MLIHAHIPTLIYTLTYVYKHKHETYEYLTTLTQPVLASRTDCYVVVITRP